MPAASHQHHHEEHAFNRGLLHALEANTKYMMQHAIWSYILSQPMMFVHPKRFFHRHGEGSTRVRWTKVSVPIFSRRNILLATPELDMDNVTGHELPSLSTKSCVASQQHISHLSASRPMHAVRLPLLLMISENPMMRPSIDAHQASAYILCFNQNMGSTWAAHGCRHGAHHM